MPTLALIGGSEWSDGCSFDSELIETAGTNRVLILPTAAAFEHPDSAIERAATWFTQLGVSIDVCRALHRRDAFDQRWVDMARSAAFIYVAGGSPMHLRMVLKETPLWDAVLENHRHGTGVLAVSAESATVLCKHMVDLRGGAFTVGLNDLPSIAVVPRLNSWSEDKWHRTIKLAPAGVTLLGIQERTAAIWNGSSWSVSGAGTVTVVRDRQQIALTELAAPFGAAV